MWTWPRLVAVLCVVTVAETVRLSSRLGELEGSQRTTPITGRPYFAFTSLPYAQPPVGPLRLRNPVETNGWKGVLDATKRSPLCIQNQFFFAHLRKKTFGQEDCLYLNVYTPTVDSGRKLPVLVYVHGGGFRCGCPVMDEEAQTNFMEEDVVLVTIHYRVGILGFLSTEDSEIPGNFGLKDQALAIKWVSQNIEAFGGDSSSITVFGESAGGASTHYLITSPLSRDLLKGGIAQSGVADTIWGFSPPGSARKSAKQVAQIVGCDFEKDVLSCLQKKDPTVLQAAELNFLIWDFDPIVFRPVIEPQDTGAFLTEDPRKMELTKPLITGVTTGEGILKSASIFNQEDSVLDYFTENFDTILPQLFYADLNSPKLSEFISAVKERYFKNLSNRQDTIQGLENLYGDIFFIYPFYKSLQRHQGPKYGYIFDHKAQNSISSLFGNKQFESDKPSHGDDLLSLFNWTSGFPNKKSKEDVQVSSRLVRMWVNFAKHQNPTPDGSESSWRQYESGKVLHITTSDNTMIPFPYDDVIEFWDKTLRLVEPSMTIKEEL